jgi:hypothetical protein
MLSLAHPGAPAAAGATPDREWHVAAAAIGTVLAGLAMAMLGGMPLVMLLALPVVVVVTLRPAFGAYLFLFANPLIVGIARGDPVPLLRPNELLLVLLIAALALRVPARVLSGNSLRPGGNALDVALLLLAVFGSLLPLVWRHVRSLPVSTDDFLYAVVLWKYLALYWFFRQSITTMRQVLLCLAASMAAGVIVATVAMLQVNNLLGVPELLHQYYDSPFTGFHEPVTSRGTSTIASSFGTADVMIMNLLIALALLRDRHWRSWRLTLAATIFLVGCLAAGAFSGVIGLVVALLAFGVIVRQTGRILLASVPVTAVGMIAFWPVIAGRLAGFEGPSGLPHSWEGRWANLRDFFLPEIMSGVNWLTGVRPAARVPAPESWRDFVYIESGYVWLLWIGGVPFLLAFLGFAGICGWLLWRVTQTERNPRCAAASAGLAYLVVIMVLMLLDPHLTVRGSADLFFPLLALAMLRRPEQQPHRRTAALPYHRGGSRQPAPDDADGVGAAPAGRRLAEWLGPRYRPPVWQPTRLQLDASCQRSQR